MKLSADGKYQFKGGMLSGDVTAKLDDSTIKAKFTAAEPYEFDASIDKLNLDRYLGAAEKPAGAASSNKKLRKQRKTAGHPGRSLGAERHQREGQAAGRRAARCAA